MLIKLLRKEYPFLLETLLLQRKADFPLPPSQIFIRCLTKNAMVRKEGTDKKTNEFPLWAMLLALVAGVLYIYMAKMTTLGIIIPVINVIFVIAVSIYAFGIYLKK